MTSYLPPLPPELVWGLFTRGIGLVFLISFASLIGQVVRNAGRRGGAPIAERLAKMREDFPTWRRFYYFPTLVWLNDSDAMLRGLTWFGLGSACMVVYGGPFSFWGLLGCYVAYLSLDMCSGLIFPWDSLLFESTVLSLFLPATHALPSLTAVSAPAPALTWAYRLLLFRVMFGFGKQKFLGAKSKDLSYLKGFLVTQPLPSPLGWYMQKLPTTLLKGAVLFMFLVEIPVPFLAFFPGDASIVCAAATVSLMIGIQLMGSFGYFSLLTIVSCIPLLDVTTPRELHLTALFAPGAPVITNAYVVVHTLCAGFAFLFNSWVGQSYHQWAFWYQLPKAIQPFFGFLRFMHPFRWLHPYGVFPPATQPGVKISLLMEATWDEKEWHELEFHFSPSNDYSAPKFIAPYHPRGDQAVIYDTFGLNPTSFISSMVGPWDPYPYGSRAGSFTYCQRVLEGRHLNFVKGKALSDHTEPPLSVRITTVMLEPVTMKEHRETGKWWKRTYVGPHVPPLRRDPQFWDDAMAEPELWHFDAIFWRRRSRLKKLLDAAIAPSVDPMALALVEGKDLVTEDVERFWNEFVPLIGSPTRDSFDNLPETVEEMKQRFERRANRANYRLLNRFAMILVARLEPLYLHRWLNPLVPANTYFHLWMLAHHIIGNGKEAYLAAVADPPSVAAYLPSLTAQTGLYALCVFRFDEVTFEAQKLRLITSFVAPHDLEAKRAMAHDIEALPPTERKLARFAQKVSGFFNVMPVIRDNFKGPRFDRGYPELYPSFRELDSGEVVLRAYATRSGDWSTSPEAAPAE